MAVPKKKSLLFDSLVHIRVTNFLMQMTGHMATCSGDTATTQVRKDRYCSRVIISKAKFLLRFRWVMQLGSNVSTGDIRLDRRHIVGLQPLALSQLHRVSPLGGLRPL